MLYNSETPNSSFEVPAGFTAVVREIDLYAELGGEGMQAFLQGPGASIGIGFAALQALGANTSVHWEGRVVAPENYLIAFNIAGVGLYSSAYVGGYLLRNNLT